MPSRRRFLATATLLLATGAGCIADVPFEVASDATEDDGASDGDEEVLFTVTDGEETVELATLGDVESVGDVRTSERLDGYQIPITLTDDGAAAFREGLETIGAFEDPQAHEIRTHFDGEIVHSATLGPDLAATIESGEWTDRSMLLLVDDRETAEEMKRALEGERTERK